MNSLAKNKKAFHDFEIIEKFEAGISLTGTEVKSIKDGRVNMRDSHVKIINHEAFIVGLHVSEYLQGNRENHDPTRSRKLLLHRKEIDKLESKIQEKGLTVVPLGIHLTKNNLIKVGIALGKGKKAHDKRQVLKERDLNREASRELKKYK